MRGHYQNNFKFKANDLENIRMCDPVTIAVVTMAAAGGLQAYGQVQEGKSQSAMYKYAGSLSAQKAQQEKDITAKNVELTKRTAEQNRILIAGEAAEESKALARKTTEVKGAQRAAMGKLGIGGATAEDIVSSTFDKAKLDQLAIQYNADVKGWAVNEEAKNRVWGLKEQSKRDIWALKAEEEQYGYAAKYAKKASRLKAAGTLLGTAASMAGT